MTLSNFEIERERGREYEVAFSRWLQHERGYHTLPAFDFSGLANDTAPHFEHKDEWLVVPDILACKDGSFIWFELKLKDRADLHRITQTRVTGLPLRHWQHYQATKELTCLPVWIVFVHLEEGEVRAEEIGSMETHHIYREDKMSNGGMVFFEYARLRCIATLDALNHYREDV
jgi:hypothetical protein